MKNIHVLLTDKPSRLYFNHNKGFEKYQFSKEPFINGLTNTTNQNIYIANDEEIKEGDWFIYKNEIIHRDKGDVDSMWVDAIKNGKKIILTTDQDLIKDGVQKIDDEFLEWFVKNPICESVEVLKEDWEDRTYSYEIIIPKEEPKMIECYFIPSNNTSSSTICSNCGQEKFFHTIGDGIKVSTYIINPKEEPKQECKGSFKDCFKPLDECVCDIMKQETLEEAAESYSKKSSADVFQESHKKDFINGAKWKQERSYSEEEVRKSLLDIVLVNPAHISMLKSGYGQFPDTYEITEKGVDYIIEQFKKK